MKSEPMDRNECIRMLKELLAQIENFSSIASDFDDAKARLNVLRTKSPSAVRNLSFRTLVTGTIDSNISVK